MAASIARCWTVAARTSVRPVARSAVQFRPAMPSARAFSVSAQFNVRRYTKDHEWVDLNADNTTGVIGISEFAAEALGDVVYVELPAEGKEVGQGDAIGAVESVKSAADINAPIACKVTHVNTSLEETPGTINQTPEDDSAGGGWIAKVQVDEQGVKEFEELMSADEYKAFTASEDH
ncbi:glycine cleavage system H protein [Sporothrix brasiliensis 5110]|uniref:Glycine cleavage system H protein n=1 Tax=Sporothrix brasiliensis 5110 TaxID=1398154 RepID=A0A0C2IUJ9_9PEZI|nr:glycine cleavage system H protein [Sporothrix brasiliensis 5110]KIH92826.1 glycine cleavage system H protein [Sporothrix brasiliensis 5110]